MANAETTSLHARKRAGGRLAGAIVKTPNHVTMEILILAGLDFVCIDAERAPFDCSEADAALAVAYARNFPVLVRIGRAHSGCAGCGCHRDRRSAWRHCREGPSNCAGRSVWHWRTRLCRLDPLYCITHARPARPFAGRNNRHRPDRGAGGCGGLRSHCRDARHRWPFTGPTDITVAYGRDDMHIPDVAAAMGRVGRACAEAGKTDATRVPDLVRAREWRHHCFPMFVVASEHGCMLQDARAVADGISEPS